jgi:formate hydrogenlyase transcriptional activator
MAAAPDGFSAGRAIDPSEQAQLLLEINNAVVSHIELAPLLRAVSACLRRAMPHDFAGLAMYHPEAGHLRVHGLNFPEGHPYFVEGQIIPVEGTPGGLAVKTGRPVLRHRPDPEEFPAEVMKQAQALGIKSGIVVPMIRHGETLGTLVISSFEESKYTEADVELLSQIAAQVAIAVQNVRNYDAMRRAEKEMARERDRSKLLLDINNAVISKLDLSSLLKAVSASLRNVISYDSTFLALCNAGDREMHVRALDRGAIEGAEFREGNRIQVEGTPEELAMRSRKPVLIKSVADLLGFPSPMVRYAVDQGIKSGCAIPLIAHDRVLGALGVVSLREGAFTEEDAKLLEQCSAQIAIAVENALNFEKALQAEAEVRQERDRSQLLLEVNNAVITHLNLSDLLTAISASLNSLLPHDSTFIALREPDGIHFRTKAQHSGKLRNVKFTEGLLVPVEGTPEERVVETGKPVVSNSAAELGSFPSPWARHAVDVGIRSGCSVPLTLRGNIIGVLGITSMQEQAFKQEDAALLEQCATQIAIAVENAVNFEKAREAEQGAQRERDRSDLLLEINNALVSNLELDELVKGISRSLQQLIRHDCVGLAIYDAESGKMFAQAVSSNLEPMLQGVYYAPEGTVSGATFASGEPTYVWPLNLDRFSSATTKGFIDQGLKTLYAIPLVVHGNKIGVMSISSVRDDAFSKEDQHLFQQIGKQVALAAANSLAVRDLENLKNKLAQEKLYLEDEIRTELNFDEIVGQSPALRQVLQMVETVAGSDSTVLLLGETGTGKELIARAVHNHSRRKNRTFVKLNCAAIPTGLLESELFGHERGAFTGAIAQKIGRMELADQGTLFLDEVGDIPIEIQPKLLRALQEKEFERLGSTHTKHVNIRLVAATNRNLEKMIENREFRSDLYYRLNVFPIRIPPLRERTGDIPLLVRYFAQKCARQMQKNIETIPVDTMAKLQAWHWPGNVRELENVIERAVILTSGTALQVSINEIASANSLAQAAESTATLAGTEREHIVKILRETRGVLAGPNGAASRLGVKRTTLQYKMKKLGITREQWWPTSPA